MIISQIIVFRTKGDAETISRFLADSGIDSDKGSTKSLPFCLRLDEEEANRARRLGFSVQTIKGAIYKGFEAVTKQ